MALLEPDIDEFIATQDELRAVFGSPCVFRAPTVPAWPVGTKINPDTDLPYDSTLVQTNPEFVETEITVLVILKQGSPLRPQADTHWDQVGLLSGMDIILDVSNEDYAGTVVDASEFRVNGLTYDVMEAKPFSLDGKLYRFLVYGQEQ